LIIAKIGCLPIARARSIEIDLLSGHFEPTLEKYKGGQKAPELQKTNSILELYEEGLKHLTGNGKGEKTISTMRRNAYRR
jgi:hypothetical protein